MTFTRKPAGGHWTYLLDGKKVPSVTTLISGGVPKQLTNWAAKAAAEYAADNLDRLIGMDRAAIIDLVSRAHTRDRDAAALHGNKVHAIAEKLAAGQQVDISDEQLGTVDGYLKWLDEWRPEILGTEVSVASRRWRYAGTTDILANLDGFTAIVDIKTGRRVYKESALQIAAYRHAEVMLDAAGLEVPLPAVNAGYVLWLPGDGIYELLPVECGQDIFHVYLHACRVAGFGDLDQDAVIGAALSPAEASA